MKPKNIIWIVIDALRADHLGCYGYARNTSPNIDLVARQSVLFEYAFAPASYTVPIIASLLTSKYPAHQSIGFDQSGGALDPDTDITIAEILNSCGYRAAGFVSSMVLGKHTHFDMGFDFYDARMTKPEINRPDELVRDGSETKQALFNWLDENHTGDPLFVFLHYFDVHGPYVNPEPFERLFVDDEFYGAPKYVDHVTTDSAPQPGHFPNYQLLNPVRDAEGNLLEYERDVRYYIAQYDGGISYEDTVIKETMAKLQELGIYDESLIVITADHGESLGENGVYFFHGLTVTPDQTRVPLIIKPPKGWDIEPRSVPSAVSTIDIVPTILDFAGYNYDGLNLQGQSFIQLMRSGEDDKQRTIISEIEGQIAYVGKDDIIIKPKKVERDKLKFLYNEQLCEEAIRIDYRKGGNGTGVLDWTGERFLPWMDDPTINYEHLHRYKFAAEFVEGRSVLDLACGEGYGCAILAERAGTVVGIDIDERTIDFARQKYAGGSLEFVVTSMTDISLPQEHCFDVITCFEALEHVAEHEKLMSEVKRFLKEDGIFIVSTPDRQLHEDKPDYHNPFHVKELYFEQFTALLNRSFRNNVIYGQEVYPTSKIFSMSGNPTSTKEYVLDRANGLFEFAQNVRKRPRYFIGVSSDSPIDAELACGSYLIDASERLFELSKSYLATVSEQEAIINDQLATLNQIYGSFGWRFLAFCYKWRDRIFRKKHQTKESEK